MRKTLIILRNEIHHQKMVQLDHFWRFLVKMAEILRARLNRDMDFVLTPIDTQDMNYVEG